MRTPFLWFTVILTSMLLPYFGYAGSEMGNGADQFFGDTGAAWFTGSDKTVTVCIQSSPLFGRSDAQVEMDIQIAWAKWLNYAAQKLNSPFAAQNIGYPRTLKFQPCDGSEDLRLMLGVEDSEVTFQKQLFNGPVGISYREKFDDIAGWGQGWIWFCLPNTYESVFPNWSNNTDFQEILLHEIGHVFGNPHVEGTVMELDLAGKLSDGEILPQWIGKIDQSRTLAPGSAPLSIYTGELGGDGYFDQYRAFRWLSGRDAQGSIAVTLTTPASQQSDFVLAVTDSIGTQKFAISLLPTMNNPEYDSDTELFKRAQNKNSAYVMSGGRVSFAALQHGSSGNVMAFINDSMSSVMGSLGPIQVQAVVDGYPQMIFRGYPQN